VRRLSYVLAAQHDPLIRRAWQFLDRTSYRASSYSKTALMLDTLDAYLGGDTLRQAFAAYYERWRFRHPEGSDLLAALSARAGQDLSWYFDQLVSGTGVLDYAVTRVDADKVHALVGYAFAGNEVREEVAPRNAEEQHYRSEVVVERLGSVVMPVEIQIVFEDGSLTAEQWDGRDRWKRYEYTGAQRVEWAVVDPRRTMPLDVNWLNNSRMRVAGTRGIVRIASRWGFWFQNLLSVLTGL